ncbi:MAG: phosphonate ABC transporter, permease protein PhnE, partial [Pseudomonadota bacterium]
MTATDLSLTKHDADKVFQRKRLMGFGIPVVIFAYLVYILFAFDIPGLAERANLDNAVTLASDSWSHKVHVTRDNRSGEVSYAVEGERKGRYPEGQRPDWVSGDEVITIGLGGDHIVRYLPDNRTEIEFPGFPLIEVQAEGRSLTSNLPDDLPDWISASNRRIGITTPEGRITLTGARTEVFNYFPGWELFWFTLDSPYHGQGLGAILFGERLDPERGNVAGAVSDWWNNKMWRHKDVAWAIGETILMAFLGTMGAAILALPLAFLAAKRFSPLMLLRAGTRRVFDFVRGVDALIWTVVLARAFGPGPLTGTL